MPELRTYWSDLFTVETWAGFRRHGGTVSGFRARQRNTALSIVPGDTFICYLVGLSRWCGILEIESSVYEDSSPIFADPDPFVLRFKVRPRVVLEPEYGVPIFESEVWSALSITRDLPFRSQSWAQHANLRSSLRKLTVADGEYLEKRILQQDSEHRVFEYSSHERRHLAAQGRIQALDRKVLVAVPDEAEEDNEAPQSDVNEARESFQKQAAVAEIGAKMGFRIWVPRSDRGRVSALMNEQYRSAFLEDLPLNYDDATLRTIEQIDVIWLRGRSMARAFEIEHATAIYSGLLRMADLLALQPNMDIAVHIVAPDERRDKVLREIKRPVFSLLDRGPLYERCSFLPYSAIDSLASERFLNHMNESILEEYADYAEDV